MCDVWGEETLTLRQCDRLTSSQRSWKSKLAVRANQPWTAAVNLCAQGGKAQSLRGLTVWGTLLALYESFCVGSLRPSSSQRLPLVCVCVCEDGLVCSRGAAAHHGIKDAVRSLFFTVNYSSKFLKSFIFWLKNTEKVRKVSVWSLGEMSVNVFLKSIWWCRWMSPMSDCGSAATLQELGLFCAITRTESHLKQVKKLNLKKI